ncbi:hypothetical protein [Cetobacterium sp.]|uniref:hypothetical protein n=1 Tax=Cetobacterium sp. TaxID=2071632 RepID=UPI002FC9B24D
MSEFLIPLKIYDKNKYIEILTNHFNKDICGNYYDGNDDKFEYFKELLILSNYNCFYCGSSLLSHNEKGVLFDKEHIINKTIDDNINYALNRCIYNLIPICKTCNSKKLVIPMTSEFKFQLIRLKEICERKKGKKRVVRESDCIIDDCLETLRTNHFNPFSQKVKFDVLANRYEGDDSYIEAFLLNERCDNMLDKLNESLYELNSTFCNKNYIEYLKELYPSTLERGYIDLLKNLGIISESGTINLKKLNNLIRTKTLLKTIY